MPGRIRLRWVFVVLCGLSLIINRAPATAQDVSPNWQPLGGPGGRITHLAADSQGKVLYAVSVTGVNRREDHTQWYDSGSAYRSDALYRSEDGGATWQPVTNDLPPGSITALYVDPLTGDLYAGIQGNGDASSRRSALWRSADRGQHWQSLALSQANDLLIRSITHNAGGGYLLLGITDSDEHPQSYVYKSGDGGFTWAVVSALQYKQGSNNILADLIPHPTRPNRMFLTTYDGDLLISNDAGQTWNPAAEPAVSSSTNLGPAQLAFSVDAPDTALLIRGGLGTNADAITVSRSTDGGATWRALETSGLPNRVGLRALGALPAGIFLLNTTAGTYRSADGGLTWQALEGALSSGGVAEFLALPASSSTSSESGTIALAATGNGIFGSRDGGAVWQPFGAGLPPNSKIAGLITHPGRVGEVLAISDNRSLWGTVQPPVILRSMDSGRRWSPTATGLPDASITAWTIDPNDPSALFIASWDQVFRSTDAGLSWQTTRLDSSARKAIAVASSDGNVIYLGGRPALRSTDRGITWQPIAVVTSGQDQQTQDVTGLVVDPQDADHAWAALDGGGVYETQDGGRSWRSAGLDGKAVRWLAAGIVAQAAEGAAGIVKLYAGVFEDGIYRWDGATAGWVPASAGLPAHTTVLSFAADARRPGLLWAGRDGGGVYRSTDDGASWINVGAGVGDNLAMTLAVDYSAPDSVLMGTATAGVWALRSNSQPVPSPQVPVSTSSSAAATRAGVDARIEVVWPHDWAPVTQARLANLGLRLFIPASLASPPCGWQPNVTVWEAANTEPAAPLAQAEQRTVDGQPFPFWELNDIDVSRAIDPKQKLYFMVRIESVDTATSVWAHGADPRTYFPQQDVPSGIATGQIDAVDARIQIVWPHDEAGNPRPVTEGTLANVAVTFFEHGTRLSVPVGWRPAGLTLFGAWNQEVGKPLATQALSYTRQAGAITYPVWEFDNIPVARATVAGPSAATAADNPADHGSTLYLWIMADGVQTYPNIWAHGADSRTYFPAQDEPIQGCTP